MAVKEGRYRRWRFKTNGGLAIALCSALVPSVSHSADWRVTPTIQLQERFDDNFRLDTDESDSVLTSRLSGRVELSRLTETTDLRGFARWDALFYSGETQGLPDQNNQFVGASGLHRTQLGQWELNGAYTRDTVIRTLDLLVLPQEVTTDPGQDIDVQLVRTPVRRERIDVNPEWRYNITERSGVGLGYRFNDVSYEEVEGISLIDYQNHRFDTEAFHRLTEVDRLRTVFEARFFRSDEDRKYDTYALLLGADHDFSRTISAGFLAGVRYTEITVGSGDAAVETDDIGYLARIYGNARTQAGSYGATLERQLLPSGSGDLLQTDQILARFTRELAPRLAFSMRLRAFRTKSLEFGNPESDRKYLSFEPTLRWEITRWWSLEGAYIFQRDKRDIDPDSAIGNSVAVSLTYQRPTMLEF